MRNKKLVSTVVASALVATTMAMPVMAADGEVEIDVTTKTGVIRVEVPTSMAVAVDQFEIAHTGAQIYSEEFPIVNKSEIAVKVDVTSAVTTGPGITLASGKDNLTGNQAWLAAAAMTATGSYDIASTTDKTENAWDLSETNENVATFGADKTAKQTFYLEKASGAISYKIAIPDANGKVGESFAKFYELADVTINQDNSTEDDQLQNAVNASDVYVVENDTTSTPQKLEADGKAMTKLVKGTDLGTESVTWAATNKYYKLVDDTADTPASGSKYVYAAMGTAGTNGAAGFTYIGKLSDEKATWTNSDISHVKIAYDITGVTATNYAEKATRCTYGLYKATAKPSIATKTYAMTANTPIEIAVDLGIGDLVATGVSRVMDPTGAFNYLSDAQYASYDSANKKITLTAAMVDACIAGNVSGVNVIFDDVAQTSVTITLTN